MQAVVDFILEIDELQAVTRKVGPPGLDRYENSAEHTWQLAPQVERAREDGYLGGAA